MDNRLRSLLFFCLVLRFANGRSLTPTLVENEGFASTLTEDDASSEIPKELREFIEKLWHAHVHFHHGRHHLHVHYHHGRIHVHYHHGRPPTEAEEIKDVFDDNADDLFKAFDLTEDEASSQIPEGLLEFIKKLWHVHVHFHHGRHHLHVHYHHGHIHVHYHHGRPPTEAGGIIDALEDNDDDLFKGFASTLTEDDASSEIPKELQEVIEKLWHAHVHFHHGRHHVHVHYHHGRIHVHYHHGRPPTDAEEIIDVLDDNDYDLFKGFASTLTEDDASSEIPKELREFIEKLWHAHVHFHHGRHHLHVHYHHGRIHVHYHHGRPPTEAEEINDVSDDNDTDLFKEPDFVAIEEAIRTFAAKDLSDVTGRLWHVHVHFHHHHLHVHYHHGHFHAHYHHGRHHVHIHYHHGHWHGHYHHGRHHFHVHYHHGHWHARYHHGRPPVGQESVGTETNTADFFKVLYELVPLEGENYLFTATVDGHGTFAEEIDPNQPVEVCGNGDDGAELCAKIESFELTPLGYRACVVTTKMSSASEQLRKCFEAKPRGPEKMTFTWQ